MEGKALETLERLRENISLAKKIIKKYFDYFLKKQYSIIAQKLNIEESKLQFAIEEILKLNPKPANSNFSNDNQTISVHPDFIIWYQNKDVRAIPGKKAVRLTCRMLQKYLPYEGRSGGCCDEE